MLSYFLKQTSAICCKKLPFKATNSVRYIKVTYKNALRYIYNVLK